MRHLLRALPAIAILAGLALALPAAAQVDPNQQRGFSADALYDFSGFDTVNLFNGNLSLAIPIGQEYRVNGGLSYRFTLVYNSNVWDTSTNADANMVEPDQHANAGLGWMLSFGQLVQPGAVGNPTGRWLYVGEDGSQNSFYSTLHLGDPPTTDFWYTRDGAYLRLHKISGTVFDVHFPNGVVKRFRRAAQTIGSPFWIEHIRDQYASLANEVWSGNVVKFTGTNPLQINDGHRLHKVHFTTVAGETVVDRVELASFTGGTATYQFRYGFGSATENTPHTIEENCRDQSTMTGDSNQVGHSTISVALLRRVELPYKGANPMGIWEMPSYFTSCAELGPQILDLPGVLRKVVLPTLGQIEWDYQQLNFPHRTTAGTGTGPGLTLNESIGVKTKRWLNVFGGPFKSADLTSAIWTYTSAPTSINTRKTVVRNPRGDETVYHFSQPREVSTSAWTGWEYGLPFTRLADDGAGRFLSQEIYRGSVHPDNLKRQVYVAYEHDMLTGPSGIFLEDWYSTNRRPSSQKVVYHDDGGKFTTSDSSVFDGLGHYRTTVFQGDFDGAPGNVERTETANFNPDRGTYIVIQSTNQLTGNFSLPPVGLPWILGTFIEKTQSEGSHFERQEFCFDSDKGFLKRTRIHSGSVGRSANDVLSVFTDDSKGNVASEATYGGDNQALSTATGDLCGLSLPGSSAYRVDNTYQYGSLKTSAYAGLPSSEAFLSANYTLDPNTGKVKKSLDTALVATDYSYDALGRLTSVTPEAGADGNTQYNYKRAVTTSATTWDSARVEIQALPNGGGSQLTSTRVVFDPFGRVSRNRRWTGADPGLNLVEEPELWDENGEPVPASSNLWDNQDFKVDPLGWKKSTSTWYNDSSLVKRWTEVTSFDAFGRPNGIQAPDATTVTFGYSGDREVSRTVAVATGYNPTTGQHSTTNSTTKEVYDRFGRLVQVIEPSGTTGADVTTSYGYDAGGRLRTVAMTGDGFTQNRSFAYDGRGFLLSETHPEKGATGNGTVNYSNYDARGHAGRRREGAIDGDFDLLFHYDEAERLTKIEERRIVTLPQGGSGRRALKEFFFNGNGVTGTDRSRGKLKSAVRHNWVLHPDFGNLADVIVTELSIFGERGGRVSQRDTSTSSNHAFTQGWAYNDLGQVASLTYPTCTFLDCTNDSPQSGWNPAPARTVVFGYQEGRLRSVSGFTGTIPGKPAGLGFTYHPDGMLYQLQHSNDVTYIQERDVNLMSRPGSLRITNHFANPNPPWVAPCNDGLESLLGLVYSYDAAGNVTRFGPEAYTYDKAQRVTYGRLGDTTCGNENSQGYTYDAFGNITRIRTIRDGAQELDRQPQPSPTTNRLSSLAYDEAGNQLNWGLYSYTFDAFGMMKTMSGDGNDWTYVYTAGDERLWSIDASTFGFWRQRFDLRDLDGKVLRTYRNDGNFNQVWEWERDTVWRGGTLLARVVPEGSNPPSQVTYHYHPDHLGTPRLVTGPDRVLRGAYAYFPFGEELYAWDTAETARFTGHERDLNGPGVTDDLDYMHARYCSPLTGRFLSVDPGKDWDSVAPQSWNLYSYVRDNPLKYEDPTGRFAAAGLLAQIAAKVALKSKDFVAGVAEETKARVAPVALPQETSSPEKQAGAAVADVAAETDTVVEVSVSADLGLLSPAAGGVSGTAGVATVNLTDTYVFVGAGKSASVAPVSASLTLGVVINYSGTGSYSGAFTSASGFAGVGLSASGDPVTGGQVSSAGLVFSSDIGVSTYETYYIPLGSR